MSFPVFDIHCDTAYALLGRSLRECGSLLKNNHHIDLTRAQNLPGYAQCFACYCTTIEAELKDLTPVELFEREMISILREVDANQDKIRLAYNAQQIESNKNNGLCSAILSIEGPAGFGFDPALLEDLYQVGFRITTLCWNEQNPLTGSHATGGGLTDLGREYVKEAQRLGMIVDLSHISDEAFWDIMDITTAPVIASHSNSRVMHNHSRNLTDEMVKAIIQTNGVVGLNLYKTFVGRTEDLDAVCDHAEHFLSLDSEGSHIVLGGDLDGCNALVDGFDGVESYPALEDRMISRGIAPKTVENIFWKNAVGVIERCCM